MYFSFCHCGCGQVVRRKRKWKRGHCSRKMTQITKQKISNSNNGKHHQSEEMRKRNSEANTGKKSSQWKGGKSFEPYCPKFTKKVRQEIRNKFNNKCFICNRHQKNNLTKNGKIWRLSIHHVYYDKKEGCNEKDFTLIPLCLECHGKTNYDRNYWEKFLINKLEVIYA